MKKTTTIPMTVLILLSLLLAACSCAPAQTEAPESTPEATPAATPEPVQELPDLGNETIAIKELGNYTIVYPSDYTEIRMDMPLMLADNIERVTGKRPEMKTDAECKDGRRIILASGKTETVLSEGISQFEDGLTYVIAVSNGNLILGGQNYYADSNAIYDFINNYLGYDDVEDVTTEAKSEVSGLNVSYHEKPAVFIYGSTWSSPVTNVKMVKYLAEANFNGFMYTYCQETENSLHNLVRWCARYGIYLVLNRGVFAPELYYDCPIIVGHYIWDEPEETDFTMLLDLLKDYKEKYSQYGWKSWINFVGIESSIKSFDCDLWIWNDLDVSGFDAYDFVSYFYGRQRERLHPYEIMRNAAKIHGLDMWYYIQSYDHVGSPVMNTSKAYLWQMQHTMCFDPDGIIYFEYGNMLEGTGGWCAGWETAVIDRDFLTRGQHYYDAQRANKIILDEAEILKNYDQKGCAVINRKDTDAFTRLDEYYDFSDVITEITGYDAEDIYFVGCFDEEGGKGKAYLITDINYPDEKLFDDTPVKYLKAKINGDKVSCYFNGETSELTPDENGYYSIPAGNGFAALITVK